MILRTPLIFVVMVVAFAVINLAIGPPRHAAVLALATAGAVACVDALGHRLLRREHHQERRG